MLFLKHWGGERSKSFEIKSEEQHLVYVHPALNDLSSFLKKKKLILQMVRIFNYNQRVKTRTENVFHS